MSPRTTSAAAKQAGLTTSSHMKTETERGQHYTIKACDVQAEKRIRESGITPRANIRQLFHAARGAWGRARKCRSPGRRTCSDTAPFRSATRRKSVPQPCGRRTHFRRSVAERGQIRRWRTRGFGTRSMLAASTACAHNNNGATLGTTSRIRPKGSPKIRRAVGMGE